MFNASLAPFPQPGGAPLPPPPLAGALTSISFPKLSLPDKNCNWPEWRMDIEMYLRAESVWKLCEPGGKHEKAGFFETPDQEQARNKALGVIYFSVDGYYKRLVSGAKSPAEALKFLEAEVRLKSAQAGAPPEYQNEKR